MTDFKSSKPKPAWSKTTSWEGRLEKGLEGRALLSPTAEFESYRHAAANVLGMAAHNIKKLPSEPKAVSQPADATRVNRRRQSD